MSDAPPTTDSAGGATPPDNIDPQELLRTLQAIVKAVAVLAERMQALEARVRKWESERGEPAE